jgi:hypothetical protein
MTKPTFLNPGFLAAIPVAAVIALAAGSGTAMAGAHGGTTSPTPSKTPCASRTPHATYSPHPSMSPSHTPEPSDTPSATPTPSPSDEPGMGGGGGTESESPTPSATPDNGGDTLPDTGAAGVMGGMAGAGTIGYASYAYLRSKRRVLDAMRKR